MEKNKKAGNPNWKKGGLSANPGGRPKGSVGKYTALSREMMSERGPEIVQKVIEMAMDGDVHCLKMCIDRILPVHKAVDSSKSKQQSQVVINVGASDSIKAQIAETPVEKLVNPETKNDDDVIIAVGEVVG